MSSSHLFLPLHMASSGLNQIWGLGGRTSIGDGKGNLLFLCVFFSFFFFFFLPHGFSQSRPNSQKNNGGWMGG